MSVDIPQVVFWEDRPIAALSREELIEVINYAAAELSRYRTPEASRAYVLGRVEMMKRGER